MADLDTPAKRTSGLNFSQLDDLLPIPDVTVAQGDRQHLAGFYSGILASGGIPATWLYNLYVGLGGLGDIDFDTVVTTFPGGTSAGDLASYGFAASSIYTLVLRPEIDGLETPDTSAITEFKTDGAGEWVGLKPDAPTSLQAKALPGATIRLTWDHRVIDGATPDDFYITYGPDATATGTTTTATFTSARRYTKEIALVDGTHYFFKVFARTGAILSDAIGTLGITADGTAPDAPSTTVGTTWQGL